VRGAGALPACGMFFFHAPPEMRLRKLVAEDAGNGMADFQAEARGIGQVPKLLAVHSLTERCRRR
jgi:hypothetical protein